MSKHIMFRGTYIFIGGITLSTKKKYKRDYIILEAKDMNFRYKDRVLPKAFAKVEVTDDKSLVALYVENLKYIREGYKVIAILEDYNISDLGNIVLSEQGKGEFTLNLDENSINIKAIALVSERSIPLIGFKGSKIDNYEEIIFTSDDYVEYEDIEDDEYVYEEVEYIEGEDSDEYEYEYEYLEYVDMDEDVSDNENKEDEYEYEYESYEPTNNQSNQKSKINKSKQLNEESLRNNIKLNEEIEQIEEDINHKEVEQSTCRNLLMPRQIKKGLKMFKEVKPFVRDSIDNTRWWKIEITPMTMCGYTMPYLGYINTLNYTMYSDIVLQSYRYRHYLFGVQYDEYNKRKNYMYAIPGNKNEQPDQGHTGFNMYKPCDDRNDKLGYWICFVDSRTRKILK
ncbi:putative transmembrane protein [[Clostridium] sordellii]|uniref:Putative transmembrane protein n=1 Tax=Paraclostridium sordellii TaxID=1505 RepID=A0A0C7GBT0_PARSO|nr:putative transmembrane protein [[Clostridium] sordellii] [Paeniclostridium sordellii]CEO05179.1 putative transmembrane protein [[Clostridium] sordellii] [Paeniclostridium sordellii]CEP40177.1 putative transmembrane protein [[Clostridium] sordellii] [Paeniclostridium sordellii]CEP41533.1 putative transmembrane protein [[Clostridium] sordellii] [Paeniclostridium sordellii]CEP98437.1 putative transmembrane protein [[Clostridium] sordellii] [Paeniclostridium sordellii]